MRYSVCSGGWESRIEQIVRAPQQLGHALRRNRRARGDSQDGIGGKTSLRQATISAAEAGEPGTKLRTIFDILSALEPELVVRPRTQGQDGDIEALF